MTDLSEAELSAAQSAARGMPVDVAAFASFLRSGAKAAERLLAPGVHTRALGWMTLAVTVSRLTGQMPHGRVTQAMQVYRRLVEREVVREAPDLTMAELLAVGALLRGYTPEVEPLAKFFDEPPAITKGMLYIAGRSLDVALACLALRLHGLRTDGGDILEAIGEVLEQQMQQLRKEAHH